MISIAKNESGWYDFVMHTRIFLPVFAGLKAPIKSNDFGCKVVANVTLTMPLFLIELQVAFGVIIRPIKRL